VYYFQLFYKKGSNWQWVICDQEVGDEEKSGQGLFGGGVYITAICAPLLLMRCAEAVTLLKIKKYF